MVTRAKSSIELSRDLEILRQAKSHIASDPGGNQCEQCHGAHSIDTPCTLKCGCHEALRAAGGPLGGSILLALEKLTGYRAEDILQELKCMLGDIPFPMPEDCKKGVCSYYVHYIAYYDPEKNGAKYDHLGYHAAEYQCEKAQERVLDWMDNHADGAPPAPLMQIAKNWERRICA